jgi:hypothetical protein
MIGAYVTFRYDGNFDRDRVVAIAQSARSAFENLPGLCCKFFTFNESQQRVTNFYLWSSREQADAFFSEQLKQRVTDLYGVPPAIAYVEIAEWVCNRQPAADDVADADRAQA